MRVVSVNVKLPPRGGTAIDKQPQAGPVAVTVDGLAGDGVGNKRHHGGPDQAVYAYGTPDYAWWEAELGRPLAPGTFGENLTIEGLESAELAIGDRLVAAGVTLEVTSPRIPCATLAARMDDRGSSAASGPRGVPACTCGCWSRARSGRATRSRSSAARAP